jgi:hypothetical protein
MPPVTYAMAPCTFAAGTLLYALAVEAADTVLATSIAAPRASMTRFIENLLKG